jgi:hypothetical protein
MRFLPLGECILPLVLLKLGKPINAVHTKTYLNVIGVLLGEVTEMAENLQHCFAFWGLGLTELCSSYLLRVFRRFVIVIIIIIPGLRGIFTRLVITIQWWISIATPGWLGGP